LHHIQPDHLGTPRKVIQTSNNTAIWNWPILGNAFGEAAPTGAITLNLRFPGQYFDAETGLNYNYFRDYEPGAGRYVESDPIGLRGGVSTFGYVSGHPLTSIDPFGLLDSAPLKPRLAPLPALGNALRGCVAISLNPIVVGIVLASLPKSAGNCSTKDKSSSCGDGDDDCKQRATEWELRNAGIDAHEAKKHWKPMKHFEICKCQSGPFVFVLKRYGCQGSIIEEVYPTHD